MRLSAYLNQVLVERLNEHRIVVWYDGERAFGGFVASLQAPNCRIVSAARSELEARREAEAIYCPMDESPRPAEANANLLIYFPHYRAPQEQRTQDPFEVFAVAGTVFGESESEGLQSLARAAMPELAEQIDSIFLAGKPTLELLDELNVASAHPLVERALGTQSPVEVCALLLGIADVIGKLKAVPGVRNELLSLLHKEIGFAPPNRNAVWPAFVEQLASYILVSELALDLPVPMPEALVNIPRAGLPYRERIYAICDRLRTSDDTREVYIALANQIEEKLRLPEHFSGITELGERDTFDFEERQYLHRVEQAVQAGDLGRANDIIQGRRQSVWQHQPERAQVWRVVERCVNLLRTASALQDGEASLIGLVRAYARELGLSDVDREQRLMEQSWADCSDCGEVAGVIEQARRRYRDSIGRLQERFLERVETEGWPPEGLLRQAQVFDRWIAPALERREKVAFILADSLRFEMGRALAVELDALGEVTVQPAAAALPTITVNGMAALLPGADGALSLRKIDDAYIPYLGDRPLKNVDARMAVLSEKYGDRFTHLTLGDWLDYTDRKRAAVAKVDLLTLRVPDIDDLGEHVTLRQARKHMSGLLGDLKLAITQLARLGFDMIIIVADHGHVLLPEVQPGDVVTAPAGQWGLNRRRLRLGQHVREQAGSLILKPSHVGIQTDAPDFVVPTGFGVYASDANYFHEGLSLQECVIPVVQLKPRGHIATSGRRQQIEIRYRSDKFTSPVIGLKLYYSSLLNEPLRVRLEAFDAAKPKEAHIGEAADCSARDENTHEVTLLPNVETDVPLLIDPDFRGEAVEIRALATDSDLVWAKLKLKNAILD